MHRAEKVQPKAASLCQKALKIGAWGAAKDDKGDEGEKPMSTSGGRGSEKRSPQYEVPVLPPARGP